MFTNAQAREVTPMLHPIRTQLAKIPCGLRRLEGVELLIVVGEVGRICFHVPAVSNATSATAGKVIGAEGVRTVSLAQMLGGAALVRGRALPLVLRHHQRGLECLYRSVRVRPRWARDAVQDAVDCVIEQVPDAVLLYEARVL